MDVKSGVVEALKKSTNALLDPKLAPKILGGEDIDLLEISDDSLTRFEFMMHLEEIFDIELDDNEIENVKTLFGIHAVIEKKILEKSTR